MPPCVLGSIPAGALFQTTPVTVFMPIEGATRGLLVVHAVQRKPGAHANYGNTKLAQQWAMGTGCNGWLMLLVCTVETLCVYFGRIGHNRYMHMNKKFHSFTLQCVASLCLNNSR